MDISDYQKVLRNWRVVSPELCEETPYFVSPSQTTTCKAFNDANSDRWVLEKIAEAAYSHKLSIAETLELLESRGCNAAHPYRRNSLGQFITAYNGKLFMLRPYVDGVPLPQDSGMTEEWRSNAMADFIISLRRIASETSIPDDGNAYAIIDFIKRKTESFEQHRPEISESLNRVYRELEDGLFPILTTLPTSFCHGDFRPDNMVWGKETIISVNGWDHCGLKPEAYDAAVMIGCIGFNNPDALISDFTTCFIHRLRDAAQFSEGTWEVFFELVIATRYSWLSEWMQTHDEKARDLETLYMNLLVTQKKYILRKWGLA